MSANPDSGPQCPNTVFPELGYPAQLVVWSVRRWLEDGETSTVVESAFYSACGVANVESALAGLEGVVEVLANTSRRVLGLHRPGCGRVSADELSLLALIAAAQVGDRDHTEALARWLVPASSGQLLVNQAMALATALRQSGLFLPRPTGSNSPLPEREDQDTQGPTFQRRSQ